MDKSFMFQLCMYLAVFGITDNLLRYFNISTEKKIIFYLVLLLITIKYLKP